MHEEIYAAQERTKKEDILFKKFNRKERRKIMKENGMFKKGKKAVKQ